MSPLVIAHGEYFTKKFKLFVHVSYINAFTFRVNDIMVE